MTIQKRKLAAIMFTDIVGYTALMGEDEVKGFEVLKRNRQVQKPLIEKYNGKWLKEIGDGVLASFTTVTDAVYCAKAIQELCSKEEDLKLRIGIHQGEVVFEGSDVFGDGVNIASRLELLAPIGGIYVSEAVFGNIENKKDLDAQFVKEETLKNVRHPVRIYQIGGPFLPALISGIVEKSDRSIAVLPFVDMSKDHENEYFCDGLSEDLLHLLAHVEDLNVAARSSSFPFKGRGVNATEIGKELKVKTVLEGSVQKSGERLRITAQLINCEDGFHLWSERYDRNMEDIFEIQDEISSAILEALKVKLLDNYNSVKILDQVENTDAYQLYLQGRFHSNKWTKEGFDTAIKYYSEAVQLEPNYNKAYSGLAGAYLHYQHNALLLALTGYTAENKIQAQKAVESDPFSLMGNWNAGWAYLLTQDYDGMHDQGVKLVELEPNFFGGYVILGAEQLMQKNYQDSLVQMELASQKEQIPYTLAWLGFLYGMNNKIDQAREVHERLIGMKNHNDIGDFELGLANAGMQDYDAAITHLEKACDRHEAVVPLLKQVTSVVDGLNENPRMIKLLEKL